MAKNIEDFDFYIEYYSVFSKASIFLNLPVDLIKFVDCSSIILFAILLNDLHPYMKRW